jgi:hypothetical protein
VQFKDIVKEKRRGNFTNVVLYLHDKSPSHWENATKNKLAYLGFQFPDHYPIFLIWFRRAITRFLD